MSQHNLDIMKSLGLKKEVDAIMDKDFIDKDFLCAWCKKPLTEFRNEISRREYRISGFCQTCQDKTFGTD